MKLLIAGSRKIEKFDFKKYIPLETDLIISGGAKGIDTLAEQFAAHHGIATEIYRPRYDLYGRAAPLKRNETMVDRADQVLVVWDGTSSGSKYTMEYAKKKGKPLYVVTVGEETAENS